jgi:hypothetical protein
MHDLVSVSADATNTLYYARLVPEENTRTVLAALRQVVATHGVFCALYTDRAGHFIHTPPAGHARHETQVGRALQQLGIELIAAHSPQARGRKERMYGTLQGRWPRNYAWPASTLDEAVARRRAWPLQRGSRSRRPGGHGVWPGHGRARPRLCGAARAHGGRR